MKKEVINDMRLEVASKSSNEGLARYAVSAFVTQADPTVEELADIRTIVSEAVTNSIIHGYKEGSGKVIIYVRLYSDRTINIRIRDFGCGIEDIKKAMQPLYTTDQSGERGGMGFAIMESFTDKLKVSSRPGKVTTVSMTKQLSKIETSAHGA